MSGRVCIGVDVGGTNLRCAMVTAEGLVLRRESEPTSICSGCDHFVSRLLLVLKRLRDQALADGRSVAVIALGVPGLVSRQGAILHSLHLMPLQKIDLAAVVSSALGVPAVVVNDANARAVAEQRFGAARPFASALVVTVGTGVGAGLILEGRLWTGIDGVAGEFGHVTVEPDGPRCGCGNRGCLNLYASAMAITAWAAPGTETGSGAGAAALAGRAREGEPRAAAAFARAGRYLGMAAAAVVNLLNMEAIVIGGGVAESFDLLAGPMRREMVSRAFSVAAGRVIIVKGELGDDAGVVGGSAIAFERLKEGAP